jgi:hypothetical protein
MDTTSPLLRELALVVVSIVLALVGALVTYAIGWVKRQKGVASNAYALGVLDRIGDAAQTAVVVTERELVQGLKKASADGRLTGADLIKVRDESLERARAYLTANGVREAEKIMNREELERLLRAKMDAVVFDLREAAATK